MNNKKIYLSGSAMMVAVMGANILNFVFNAFLGRSISFEDFGVISLINTFLYFCSIFYNSLLATINHHVAFLDGQGSDNKSNVFYAGISKWMLFINVNIALAWIILVPFTAGFFHISNRLILYLFAPVLFFYPLAFLGKGYLQGKLAFILTGILILLEPVIKLLSGIGFVMMKQHALVYLSLYISPILTGIIAITLTPLFFLPLGYVKGKLRKSKSYKRFLLAKQSHNENGHPGKPSAPRIQELFDSGKVVASTLVKQAGSGPKNDDLRQNRGNMTTRTIHRFPLKFFLGAAVMGMSTISFLALDVVLAKHYLNANLAGKYALLSLIGKIVYFLGSLFNVFIISLVSRDLGQKANPLVSFYWIFLGCVVLCTLGYIAFGLFGNEFIPLLFGKKTLSILPFANEYVAALALFTVANAIVTFHLSLKQYLFPVLALLLSLVMVIGIILYHKDILQIVHTIFVVSILNAVVLGFFHVRQGFFSRGVSLATLRGMEEKLG